MRSEVRCPGGWSDRGNRTSGNILSFDEPSNERLELRWLISRRIVQVELGGLRFKLGQNFNHVARLDRGFLGDPIALGNAQPLPLRQCDMAVVVEDESRWRIEPMNLIANTEHQRLEPLASRKTVTDDLMVVQFSWMTREAAAVEIGRRSEHR